MAINKDSNSYTISFAVILVVIVGGLLAKVDESPNGRLEFREVLNGQWVMAAIHDFSPSLPWYLYNITQALAHLMVMKAFGVHLRNVRNNFSGPK